MDRWARLAQPVWVITVAPGGLDLFVKRVAPAGGGRRLLLEPPAGASQGPEGSRHRNYRTPRVGEWPLTWGFGWSRLSESNRRPSHYEEERHRRLWSLPALLLAAGLHH